MTEARPHLIALVCCVMVILGLLHYAALTFFFYWQIWWFDIVMHFLGGLAVGLLTCWAAIVLHEVLGITISKKALLLSVMLGIVLVAGSWEIFEYYYKLYSTFAYKADTSLDVIMGIVGAAGGYVYGARLMFPRVLN